MVLYLVSIKTISMPSAGCSSHQLLGTEWEVVQEQDEVVHG